MRYSSEFPLRIVMADDDPDDRLMAKDAFDECTSVDCVGFVEDGELLLALLRQLEPLPRLILLDWNMPRKNGRETLMELKADRALSSVPTVVLTTSSDPNDIEAAIALGAEGFMIKPITFEGLVAFAEEMVVRYAPEAVL
ncbi:MAG: response regulator [Armatimonadetes bacterium]|jgi:DNA-binding NarL/FixJ family response regulator|nr:response regulator [Armatimonadota bacterium]